MASDRPPTSWPLARIVAVVVSALCGVTTLTMLCSTTLIRTEYSRDLGPLVTISYAISSAVACGISGLYAFRHSHLARRRQAARGCLWYIVGGFLGTIAAVPLVFLQARVFPHLSAPLPLATPLLTAAIGGVLAIASSSRSSGGRGDAPDSEDPSGPGAAG
jgi:H+/Cl- antiporter ClcA